MGRKLARLARMDWTEVGWRARVRARIGGDRLRSAIAPPRWDRRELISALASSPGLEATRTALAAGRWDDAIASLSASAAGDPHFKTLELLGECLLNVGRHLEAIVPLAAATTLNRGVRAPSMLAEAMLRAGQVSDARQFCSLALSRDPQNRRALELLACIGVG